MPSSRMSRGKRMLKFGSYPSETTRARSLLPSFTHCTRTPRAHRVRRGQILGRARHLGGLARLPRGRAAAGGRPRRPLLARHHQPLEGALRPVEAAIRRRHQLLHHVRHALLASAARELDVEGGVVPSGDRADAQLAALALAVHDDAALGAGDRLQLVRGAARRAAQGRIVPVARAGLVRLIAQLLADRRVVLLDSSRFA